MRTESECAYIHTRRALRAGERRLAVHGHVPDTQIRRNHSVRARSWAAEVRRIPLRSVYRSRGVYGYGTAPQRNVV
jgi:hypothetical protein